MSCQAVDSLIKHSGGEALGQEELSGHLDVGLSKIKEAQGVWLSPAWLSLRGDLSAQAPGSGQEFDLRDCAFHSWMQPGVGGGTWEFGRGVSGG